jgi:hypothetical protein
LYLVGDVNVHRVTAGVWFPWPAGIRTLLPWLVLRFKREEFPTSSAPLLPPEMISKKGGTLTMMKKS